MDLSEKVKRLGEYIRVTRLERGIKTVKEFAELTRLRSSYLSNIERGYVNPQRGPVVPSDDVLEAIANGLGVPASNLHRQLGRFDESADDLTIEERDLIRKFRATRGDLKRVGTAVVGLLSEQKISYEAVGSSADSNLRRH